MSKKINFFDGAESETVPTVGNISASSLTNYANDAAFEANEQGAPVEGNIYFNTTDKTVRYYNGTAWHEVADVDTAQTFTNKGIDGNTNTISNVDGDNVIVDAAGSLPVGTAQSALEGHQVTLDDHESRITTNEADIATNAADIATNAGNIATNATNISNNDTDILALQNDKEDVANKDVANGYAGLDGAGKLDLNQIPAAALGGPKFIGTWNAASNTPDIGATTPDQGDYYRVSVSGSTSLDGNTDWAVNDWAIFNGSNWDKIDNSDSVNSVNGESGTVVLDADDISDAATINKFASQTQLDKVDNITVTQPVDLDTIESDVAANNSKISADGSIDTHSDVDTSTVAPTDGQVLTYVTANSAWEPKDSAGGGGSGSAAKLIGGGEISWDSGTEEVLFTEDLFLEVAGLDYSANTIPVSEAGFILNADKQVAYVTPNDTNPGGNLTVSVGALTAPLEGDIVIARRDGDDLLIGDTTRIKNDDTRELYDTTSGLIPNIEEWEDVTLTSTWVSNTTMTAKKKIVGDSAHYYVLLTLSGAPSGTILDIFLDEPIETSKLLNTETQQTLIPKSQTTVLDSGTKKWTHSHVEFINATTVRPTYDVGDGGRSFLNDVTPFSFASGDKVWVSFEVPIANSATNILSNSKLQAQTTSAKVEKTATQNINSTTDVIVEWNSTPVYDDFSLYDSVNHYFVIQKAGKYKVKASVFADNMDANALELGIYLTGTNVLTAQDNGGGTSRQLDVDGTLVLDVGDTLQVRVDSSSDASYALLGIPRFAFFEIERVEDFTIYGAAQNQEIDQSSASFSSYSLGTAWGDITSITLTKGTYDIDLIGIMQDNTSNTTFNIGLGTASGTTLTGLVFGDTNAATFIGANEVGSVSVPGIRVEVSASSQTFYYKANSTAVSGSPTISYRITARKVS